MQDYKVLQFKKGDFQDNHGNYWCDMALEGVSEPVRIVVKDPSKYADGMELYGEVKEQTSKAGKTYLRFFRGQKEQQSFIKKEWQPRDDSAIRAQWAIGQSVVLYNANNEDSLGPHMNVIEAQAKELYAMVDRVKGETPVKTLETPQTGYDKAKQVRKQLDYDASDDPEFASMMAKGLEADDIKLDDIPF